MRGGVQPIADGKKSSTSSSRGMAAPSKSRSVSGPPKRTTVPKAASPAVKTTSKSVVNQAEIDNLTIEVWLFSSSFLINFSCINKC